MATDNSIYQIEPQAVLYPRNRDDLVRITKLLSEVRFAELHIAPRGGGTGTNGQSLTDGVLVDLSRHMNRILEIDPVARRVRVEPGVVKDQLNAALAPHGLFFAPELSTSNRATIGGMISTDASGQGSCRYGKTRDHVRALTMVLSDGTVLRSEPLDRDGLAAAQARPGLPGRIHQTLDRIARENAEAIERVFPPLNRCLTGYDLAHLRPADGGLDLNAVLCGSEGTLGFIAEAELSVLPIPAHSALITLRYDSFDAALRDAQVLMRSDPASIETIDERVLSLAQQDSIWTSVAEFFPEDPQGLAKGVNLVEFTADSLDALDRAVDQLTSAIAAEPNPARRGHTLARGGASVARLWQMRKRAVGLLGNMQGDRRPVAFVEDTAVPPEHLADFIAEFRAVLDARGLDYGMFGHVDAGVLHVRPALDMREDGSEALIREITEQVVALTKRYGGLLWGEHGKGVRSEFSPEFFGDLYPALQAVKAVFDPRNQFNPGKIAAPKDGRLLAVDAVPTKGQSDRVIAQTVRDATDNAMHCNGNGLCFNWDPDEAMCPSWKATRDRKQSPKGRAQLMRDWLRQLSLAGVDPLAEARALRSGSPLRHLPARIRASLGSRKDDVSHQVMESMSTCLACKSCTGGCPVKVDVPSFRAKFLELYHGRYLRPLRHHLVARLEPLLPWLARVPRLANLASVTPLTRLVGLVHTPKLSTLNLSKELAHRGVGFADPNRLRALSAQERAKTVVIVPDAFTQHYETQLLLDAIDLLQWLGFQPSLARFQPNGKPLHVHGFLGAFQRVAARHAAKLRQLEACGVDLVGLDPSMALTYRSDYAAFLPKADLPKVQILQEWLATRCADLPKLAEAARYTLLPHCTERAIAPKAVAAWTEVFSALGVNIEIGRVGCCGMAGTFGHETENRTLSEKIYATSWAGQINTPKAADKLMADGFSCRCQVREIDGVSLRHPLQVLLDLLRKSAPEQGAPGILQSRRSATNDAR
ncbi:FAD-binding and (Fe-S)-binding domain-containing protein [Thioclava sp. ES.031]|uniref:D-2-hydroxyglutarate dehydrogenase YdiJ n=1 Tax=Thioclava sp. ES.031 TaxID=1798203 RepID=UPI0020D24CAC|nr:FAD-binding and (Fe-S)-binding domain-containing protein [Thioclava sp. ES.031]